jgi:hypothetical protein
MSALEKLLMDFGLAEELGPDADVTSAEVDLATVAPATEMACD